MADNIAITPGSGATVATDDVSGVQFQKVKIDVGGDGLSIPLVGTMANGLPVDVTRVQGDVSTKPLTGQVWPINDNGASLTVDGTVTAAALKTAPVSVRLSDGTNNVDTVPVSGSLTAGQGAPNTLANAWPAKITDGTNVAGVDAGSSGLKVAIVAGAGAGAGQGDSSAFIQGTTDVTPVAGLYTTSEADPASGQAAAVQITQKRALHANLRNSAGTEIGTSGAPVRTDPTGTTTQPTSLAQVNGHSVTEPVNGTQGVAAFDSLGAAITAANPLNVTPGQTPAALWSVHVAFTASQTAQVLRTPGSGKKTYVERIIITPTATATAGPINIFDSTDTSATQLYFGTPLPGIPVILEYKRPRPLSAVNNVLKYTTGSSITGDIVVEGFEL